MRNILRRSGVKPVSVDGFILHERGSSHRFQTAAALKVLGAAS